MMKLSHGLILASILFSIGLTGMIIRRNILFIFFGLEIMMNAIALAFIVSSSYWHNPDGQVMYILVITFAAAESSIGLALLLKLNSRKTKTLDIDTLSEMYG